jgi:signal transduction histidine kinase
LSKKSLTLLTLLAVLPLATFTWLGWRVARAERLRVREQYRALIEQRLGEENRKLQRYFAQLQRSLSELVRTQGDSSAALRQMVREDPYIRQIIVLDRQGDLVHPRLDQPMNRSEREFLGEIQQLISDKDLVRLAFPNGQADQRAASLAHDQAAQLGNTAAATPSDRMASSTLRQAPRVELAPTQSARVPPNIGTPPLAAEGWFTWYWTRGMNLMYWRRSDADRLTVVALSRARWMADLLAALPDTELDEGEAAAAGPAQRICLVDASDQVIYQWGQWQPAATDAPRLEIPVVTPLSSWRLKHYAAPPPSDGVARFPIVAGVTGMACGLLSLVVVLYREYSREMREARQRVNFVNQVSHELKTPLTNIRLYTDLLERDLEQLPAAAVDKPRGRLRVITAESQRLSRLITNVLTFARSERQQLQVRRQTVDLDDILREVVERFRLALETAEIELELDSQRGHTLPLDPDLFEQILGNLISNVVRYAASGHYLGIRARVEPPWAVVEVSDRGPGIGAELAGRVFEPFVRGATGLSDTSGTGIGLSIARRLARLHGGDLTLVPSSVGASFRLLLPAASNSGPAKSNC